MSTTEEKKKPLFDIEADPVGPQLLKELGHFQKEAEKHKRHYRRAQMAGATLSAVTAFVSAMVSAKVLGCEAANQWLLLLNVGLGGTASVVASWSLMRKSLELWHHEVGVRNHLADLAREVEYKRNRGTWTPELSEKAFERMNTILSSSASGWRALQNNDKPGQPSSTSTTPADPKG